MDSVSGVGVIDKVAVVLRALAGGPLELAELQAATSIPRATVHRLAVALELHGWTRRDEQGRWCLGLELIALGHGAAAQFPLGTLAMPALRALRDDTGESVQLFVRDADGRRCVASLPSPHALRWIVAEGSVLPLGRGSAGRVLTGERDDRAAGGGWIATVEEREPGVASVSAAIRDHRGEIVAAVSVSGPVERMTRDPGSVFGAAVGAAAAAIEATYSGQRRWSP
jgi:DNA-binding IclR family transcriptional regulator